MFFFDYDYHCKVCLFTKHSFLTQEFPYHKNLKYIFPKKGAALWFNIKPK